MIKGIHIEKHVLGIGNDLRVFAEVTESSDFITIRLSAYGPVGNYDFLSRTSIDCWFNAIVHQWPDDPRTVHVLDPQHIMTTA